MEVLFWGRHTLKEIVLYSPHAAFAAAHLLQKVSGMSRQSRIEALRRLADRPGTPHEGAVARAMLRRMEQESNAGYRSDEMDVVGAYRAYMSRKMSVDEFVDALAKFSSQRWNCACGASVGSNQACPEWQKHLSIQTEIRHRFKKSDRVLYNYHAYPEDCPGRVAAYVPLKPENGSYPWAWISVKFDHLKAARQIPIVSADGWHLKQTEVQEVSI